MKKYFTWIVVLIFIILSGVFLLLEMFSPEYRLGVLMTGNVVMAILSLVTYYIVKKQLHERPQAFVRGVYSATFLKLLVCMFSILAYVLLNRTHIHKPTLFTLFGIYIAYTSVETWMLSKLSKEAN